MAAWRRKALKLFPMLRRELNDREYSIYMLYFDLLPMVREAHQGNDREVLSRVYGFADWCLRQEAQDLWNSAAVAFYEHLFDERKDWSSIVPWLSPTAINGCWPLWEQRLTPAEMKELRHLIDRRNEHAYREAAL